jgi:hypothetical protein
MVELSRVEIVFGNVLKIMEVAEEPPALGRSFITVKFDQFTITAEGDLVMYTLPVDHTVQMQVAYTDAKGNPATIDGEVTWESSDASLAIVNVNTDDSTICRVVPVGSVGQVQVTASCDADLGDGVRELLTTCDIEMVGGEAVAGNIQPLGAPDPVVVEPLKP